MYLYFGQHRDNRGDDAEQHVKADEELVDEASIRLGVEYEEQHDSSKWQDVVKDCYRQQSYKQKAEIVTNTEMPFNIQKYVLYTRNILKSLGFNLCIHRWFSHLFQQFVFLQCVFWYSV